MSRRIPIDVLLLCVSCTASTGCNDGGGVASSAEAHRRQVPTVMQADDKSLPAKASDEASVRIQKHDFGLARPSELLKHSFRIRNDRSQPWTFKLIHSSCACTVTRPDRPEVAPGAEVEVELVYRTEAKNTDARHRVGLEFTEASAPFIWLEVAARVREPLSVFPAEVNFPRLGRGKTAEQFFEVHNYGERAVRLSPIQSSVPWLSASFISVPTNAGPDQPRQVWRVTIKADTQQVSSSGRHEGQLDIQTDDPSLGGKAIPVHLHVTALAEAVPAQMFFGGVVVGKPAVHKVLLRFALNAEPSEAAEITLRHDLGERLQLACQRTSPGNWELVGTLTLAEDQAGAFVEGKIGVDFKNSELTPLQLPVFARGRRP